MEHLRKILLSTMLLMFCAIVSAQDINVSGTVLDPTGEPVIGATIMQKGTSNGTITDLDGHFSFKAPKGSIISISYIAIPRRKWLLPRI